MTKTNKQTNNLVIIKKKNSSRKSDFLWKIPSWFYDISIFHEKNTLHPNKSFKNTTKKKNGQKMAKNGQKISFYLLTFNEACLIHLTKISKKMPKICNMYVSRVPIMSTNTYTITLDILTKPCAHLKKLIKKDS